MMLRGPIIGRERELLVVEQMLGCGGLVTVTGLGGCGKTSLALELAARGGSGAVGEAVVVDLGLLAVSAGDGVRGVRLAAAASAVRIGLSCAALPRNVARLASARAQFSDRDGGEAWDTAWAEGEALALADAIAYARRARGPRGRPPVGWASLTPAELEVAQLAADGSSNPEIGAHLFISRSTVKMHLSSVYLRLGIANRAQLAREMTARAVDPSGTGRPAQRLTPDG